MIYGSYSYVVSMRMSIHVSFRATGSPSSVSYAQHSVFVDFWHLFLQFLDAVLLLCEVIGVFGDGHVLLSIYGGQTCGIIASMLEDLKTF